MNLRAVLDAFAPRQVAVNAHPEISFASGMHAGELETLRKGLGEKWAAKLVTDEVMLGVELVATMVEDRLGWYSKMMETAWAIIEEAFSSEVIVPGVTTTEVSLVCVCVCVCLFVNGVFGIDGIIRLAREVFGDELACVCTCYCCD